LSRYTFFSLVVILTIATGIGSAWSHASLFAFVPLLFLSMLGLWDLMQKEHAVLRNYPVLGHMRWIFEGIRPEIRQYLIESERDEDPFSREERSLVYQRAKDAEDKRPFGTREDVYAAGFAWLLHSAAPKPHGDGNFRVKIGGGECRHPYDASLYNISAMSFGALGANAILALNTGAKMGGFAHDTGEGGISPYHLKPGGDLIWEIGSGYFGCRDDDGHFDVAQFRDWASHDQVKMIEVKLSQGAKPGHGGVLPAAKITAEIADCRRVPMGQDCISPPGHSAFSTPIEFMHFLAQLREESGGKPVGFKLCVGHHWEFMAMLKAMIETGIKPDFIVVDGKEGGTGAAPLEFTNHLGMPLADGLVFVRNALVGAGLRDGIRLGASGKLVSAFDLVWAHALGADWCNSARGFMFAVGCIQAQACHTNRCPTGVTTQDPLRQRALVVEDKSVRVANFHRNTLKALAEIVGAAGFESPDEMQPWHLMVRQKNGETVPAEEAYPFIPARSLIDGNCENASYTKAWNLARADSFRSA